MAFRINRIKNFSNRKNRSMHFRENWINPIRPTTLQNLKTKKLFVFIYSISPNLIYEILKKLKFQVIVTKEIQKTSLIISSPSKLKENVRLRNLSKKYNIPIFSITKRNIYQIVNLAKYFNKSKQNSLQ